MFRTIPGAVVVFAAALVLSGCSKSPPPIVPVEGVVLLNGKPLPNASLQFIPTQSGLGMEYISVGTTDEFGRFWLSCNGQAGACAGENLVTVVEGPAPAGARGLSAEAQAEMSRYYAGLKNRPIPENYNSAARSPLKVVVTAAQSDYKIEMTR